MKRQTNLLKKSRTAVTSGMAFIGGLNENFQLIIKCPAHIYGVIQKKMQGAPHSPTCRFYTGTCEITHVALPQFCGKFIYKNESGQTKKFDAAFVYPLMADYMVSEDEFAKIRTICTLLKLHGFSYYDTKNRSIETLFNCFSLPSASLVEDFEGAFCCISATETK